MPDITIILNIEAKKAIKKKLEYKKIETRFELKIKNFMKLFLLVLKVYHQEKSKNI